MYLMSPPLHPNKLKVLKITSRLHEGPEASTAKEGKGQKDTVFRRLRSS